MSSPALPSDRLELRPLEGGSATLVAVRAQPGARRPGVLGIWNGHLKVGLRSPPEGGRANAELIELLAQLLDLRRGQVKLVRGERSRTKALAVEATPRSVRQRLLPLLGPER